MFVEDSAVLAPSSPPSLPGGPRKAPDGRFLVELDGLGSTPNTEVARGRKLYYSGSNIEHLEASREV